MNKQSDNDLFTYKALKEALEGPMPFHHNDDASIIAKISQNKGFYELNCISPSEKYDTKSQEGWKFHVSLGTDPQSVEAGWNVIKDIAIKHNLGNIKVVRDGLKMEGDQQGKEVTLYTWVNADKTPEDWCNIMSEITVGLCNNMMKGIRPGEPAQSHGHKIEHGFEGNKFVTYRYQHKDETSSKAQEAKPEPEENPYKEMDMSVHACRDRLEALKAKSESSYEGPAQDSDAATSGLK